MTTFLFLLWSADPHLLSLEMSSRYTYQHLFFLSFCVPRKKVMQEQHFHFWLNYFFQVKDWSPCVSITTNKVQAMEGTMKGVVLIKWRLSLSSSNPLIRDIKGDGREMRNKDGEGV